MEIVKETKSKICKMELDITVEEQAELVSYFDNACPKEEHDNLKVEWSINAILLKVVEQDKLNKKKGE